MKRALALMAAFAVAACDQPPTKEIAAAEAEVRKAQAAGADVYVSERYGEADAALQDARRRVAEKDYRGALSSAMEAADKARVAQKAAPTARALARSETEAALAEAELALEAAARARDEARAAKLPDEAFALSDASREQNQSALVQARELLESGELVPARKAAIELRARAHALPRAVHEEREAWQAAHPAPKPRARRRR